MCYKVKENLVKIGLMPHFAKWFTINILMIKINKPPPKNKLFEGGSGFISLLLSGRAASFCVLRCSRGRQWRRLVVVVENQYRKPKDKKVTN
jgi:hypothetical protein